MYTNSHKKFQHEDLALTVWRFSCCVFTYRSWVYSYFIFVSDSAGRYRVRSAEGIFKGNHAYLFITFN